MIVVALMSFFVIGSFAGFFLGIAAMARIKVKEVAQQVGVTPKELKRRGLLLRQSMELIYRFLHPTSIEGDLDYLSESSRQKAQSLLDEYNKEVK